MDKEYAQYSLESLRNWIHDAMDSGVTPQEIYDAVTDEIDLQIKYHSQRLNQANELKTLFHYGGTRPKVPSWDDLIKEGYEYTPLIPKKT